VLAALAGVLATVLSAAGSWIPSLWGDEATSIMSAQRPLPTLFRMLGQLDAVHGTYYLGLHFWGELAGFSPFAVRLPSAIAVGLAAAAVVLLAARLRDVRTAVVAGLICALLPRVTYMGEEARSFAFSAAIVAWLTVLLIGALGRDRPRALWFVGYGLLLAVGTYVFLYTILFVIVHGVVVAVSRAPRRTVAGWLIAADPPAPPDRLPGRRAAARPADALQRPLVRRRLAAGSRGLGAHGRRRDRGGPAAHPRRPGGGRGTVLPVRDAPAVARAARPAVAAAPAGDADRRARGRPRLHSPVRVVLRARRRPPDRLRCG
jgi:hypothetical protein